MTKGLVLGRSPTTPRPILRGPSRVWAGQDSRRAPPASSRERERSSPVCSQAPSEKPRGSRRPCPPPGNPGPLGKLTPTRPWVLFCISPEDEGPWPALGVRCQSRHIRAGRGSDLSVPRPLLYWEEAETGRSRACLRSHSPPGLEQKRLSSPTGPRSSVYRGRGPCRMAVTWLRR